jgi:ribose-phosphate pyrophosphokinase
MIAVHGCDVQWIDFPSGEPHCRVTPQQGRNHITIEFSYECPCLSDQIMKLMLLADAIRGRRLTLYNIIFDYLPFARQDRRAVDGDAFSLKVFANMVNSLKSEIVTLIDPHSDVAPALFDNVRVIPQWTLVAEYFKQREHRDFILVAPDAGALKKTYQLAGLWPGVRVLQGSKQRDPVTGSITATHVDNTNHLPLVVGNNTDFVIVDDICDGGRTFIELAKAIRSGPGDLDQKIILVVSHGLFTKYIDVIKEHIDEIWVRGTQIA